MKAKFFFLTAVVFFALSAIHYSAQAQVPGSESAGSEAPAQFEMDYYPPAPYPAPYPPSYPNSGWSYARCAAETLCPNGVPIGCWAYGNGYTGAACRWYVAPGAYVECTGFNDFGQWVTSWARCY